MTADWNHRACRSHDTSLFFPEEGKSTDYTLAKEICSGCPVRVNCLELGLGEKFGMWGGMSPRDRRRHARLQSILRNPRNVRSKQVWQALEMHERGMKTKEIAKRFRCTTETALRLVRDGEELRNNMSESA